MRRLLVGDVGSGKTAVAFGAAALVAAAGGQTLMMVPTEVLAEQQLRALGPLGARLGLRIAALTGATPRRGARRDPRGLRARGASQLLVGTQALLGVAGELPRLGLVDRRRAAPVRRRPARRARRRAEAPAGAAPHLLSMSATPIPRSLALALHGDLDASFLTERPPAAGRRRRRSSARAGDERRAAYARLRDALADGRPGVRRLSGAARRRGAPGAVTAVAQHARLARGAGAGAGGAAARRARRGGEGSGAARVRRRARPTCWWRPPSSSWGSTSRTRR